LLDDGFPSRPLFRRRIQAGIKAELQIIARKRNMLILVEIVGSTVDGAVEQANADMVAAGIVE